MVHVKLKLKESNCNGPRQVKVKGIKVIAVVHVKLKLKESNCNGPRQVKVKGK